MLEIGRMKDGHGRDVVVSTYGHGGVDITVTPHSGRNGRIALDTPDQQDEFARLVIGAFAGAEGTRAAATQERALPGITSEPDPLAALRPIGENL